MSSTAASPPALSKLCARYSASCFATWAVAGRARSWSSSARAVEALRQVLRLLLRHLGRGRQGPQLVVLPPEQLLEGLEVDLGPELEALHLDAVVVALRALQELLEVGELLGALREDPLELLEVDGPVAVPVQPLRAGERVGALDRGAVPEGVDGAPGALHAQHLVRGQGAEVRLGALGQLVHDLLDEVVGLHPGRPDADPEGKAVGLPAGPVLERDDAVPDLLHGRVEQHVDALAREVLRRVLGDAPVVGGEDGVHLVDDLDGDELREPRGEELGDVLAHHVVQLGGELDACGARADHHEGEQLPDALVRGVGQERALEPLGDVGAEARGVVDLLEEGAVPADAGHAERVRHGADAHHEVVVVQLERVPGAAPPEPP